MKIENCQMHGQVWQYSFYWMKGHLTDIHGPGGDWRGNQRPQDPTMYGQMFGSICLMHRNAKRSKNGLSRNQSSIMPDTYVASSSSNLRMRTSRTSWNNACRKLEIPMPGAMPCRTPKSSGGETYCGIGKSKTKHACFVEADESTKIRLEGAPCRYHEDPIAAKGINSLSHYNSVHKFIPMHQALKNTRCEGCSGKRMGKHGKDTGMAADESQKQKRSDRWSKEWREKSSFCVIDGSSSSLKFLDPKFQNYKARVVLRGDIVEDDPGSYAVLTEQGSSASQMTAAKIMDIISRVPACAGQAADAVSAYTKVKIEDAPTLLKIPKSECPDIWTRLPKH